MCEITTLPDPKDDRALNKLILLIAFNAKTPELAASAVWDQARDDHKLTRYKLNDYGPIKTRLKLLKQKHPIIEKMIANDYGLKLQYFDSCIMERVVAYLTSLNMPVLTVHDSVICQLQHEELVRNTMLRCFYMIVDALLGHRVKPSPVYSKAGFVLNHLHNTTRYGTGSLTLPLEHDPNNLGYQNYYGNIANTVDNNLAIKRTARTNTCSARCNHIARIEHKLKYTPNIKLGVRVEGDRGTRELSIR